MDSYRKTSSHLTVVHSERRIASRAEEALQWEITRSLLPLRAIASQWGKLVRPGQESMGPEFVLSWFETMGDSVEPLVLTAHGPGPF